MLARYSLRYMRVFWEVRAWMYGRVPSGDQQAQLLLIVSHRARGQLGLVHERDSIHRVVSSHLNIQETRMGHLQFCEVSGAAICSKHNTWVTYRHLACTHVVTLPVLAGQHARPPTVHTTLLVHTHACMRCARAHARAGRDDGLMGTCKLEGWAGLFRSSPSSPQCALPACTQHPMYPALTMMPATSFLTPIPTHAPRWCQIHTFDQRSDVVGRDSKGGSLFHFSSHISEDEWSKVVAAYRAVAAPAPAAALAAAPAGNVRNATGDAHYSTLPGVPVPRSGKQDTMPGHIFHALKW
jgi:hypothetical protein